MLFWRGDYGMCELGRSPGTCWWPTTPARRRRPYKKDKDKGREKPKDFNAVLLVRVKDLDRARPTVEELLAVEARRFELAEVEQNAKGQGVLKYRVRFGRKTDPRNVEDALLARGGAIVGVRVH
ncbi:MAG: hypothetical protein R2882_00915 [Gemmatimonadales bacterium]